MIERMNETCYAIDSEDEFYTVNACLTCSRLHAKEGCKVRAYILSKNRKDMIKEFIE